VRSVLTGWTRIGMMSGFWVIAMPSFPLDSLVSVAWPFHIPAE